MDSFSASAPFEFSTNQKELWNCIDNVNNFYNQITIDIAGSLDKRRLLECIQILVKKNDVLSSKCFLRNDSVFPSQGLSGETGVDLFESDAKEEEPDTIVDQANRFLNRPYDPFVDKPVRFYLGRINDLRHLLFIRLYSLWGDSYSSKLLYRQLCAEYFNVREDRDVIEHKIFAKWQNDLVNDPDEEGARFWKNYNCLLQRKFIPFEKNSVSLFLPKKRKIASFSLERYTAFRNISGALETDMTNLSLGLFSTYLSGFTSKEIEIGYTPFRRNYKELDATLGLVNKTFPVKFNGNEAKDITSAVRHISTAVDEVVSWGDYFHLSDIGNTPSVFFPYCFEYADLDKGDIHQMDGPSFTLSGIHSLTKPFLLKLFCSDDGDRLDFELYYDGNSFSDGDIDVMVSQLKHRFETVSTGSTDVSGLSELENFMIRRFGNSSIGADTEKTIVSLFEEQVEKTPDKTALVFGDIQLSFRDLNEQVNRLAGYLRDTYDIHGDDLIGIKLGRSEWMMITILGALKSGGAYLPIDPDYPPERISYMVSDSHCKVVIDADELIKITEKAMAYSGENPVLISRPADLAYVSYTSGSTGRPKGVMVSNRSVVDYLYAILGKTNISECKSFGLVSTIAADLGNTVIYTALLTGGELHIFSETDIMNSDRMLDVSVDCLKIVPSHWKSLQGENELFAPDKCLIFGGEQLTEDVIDILRSENAACKVYNHYGPSETTIGKLIRHIDLKDADLRISLGFPFGNTRVYILDDNLKMTSIGVAGEICIGGDGLAKGYLNKPELTAEKFVPDPYKEGGLIYKTGDLGRWLSDGSVEFLGRKDDQVKIRGFRIEPGEIINVLQSYPEIDSATVIARSGREGEKELVAYLVSKPAFVQSDLEIYLKKALPAYMMPSRYIQLDKLPLTGNGKIDRQRLPDPEDPGVGGTVAYLAPRNATEKKLAEIWQGILGREKIGIKDNFFALGGHSLKVTRLASQINKEFDIKIKIRDLFEVVELEEQALLIRKTRKDAFSDIPLAAVQPDYALSSSQRRLWILSQIEEGSVAYNMPATYVFEGNLDRAALAHSFDTLIERHENLRTIFREDSQGNVRQFINSPEVSGFTIAYKDLRDEKDQAEKIKALVWDDRNKPFILHSGPLLRAGLYQVEEHKWIFCYVMHHIVGDGWSMGILIKELLLLYNAYAMRDPNPLPPLKIQYKDYAAWQQTQLKSPELQDHKAYWLKEFEGDLPVLELPGDKTRPAIKAYNGGIVTRVFNERVHEGIKGVAREQGATLFMGLLAGVNILLYKYTDQQDIIIGSSIAGRDHLDLEDQIGFYVNTLALRSRFKGEDSYTALVGNIRRITLDAYAHQIYPFDALVDELDLKRDTSRNPLFDVMILLQNTIYDQSAVEYGLAGLKVSGYKGIDYFGSKFDLIFSFVETEKTLQLNIEYNKDIYYERTIERMFAHLEQLLAAVIAHPSTAIDRLDYLPAAEKGQLLAGFNATQSDSPGKGTILDLFEAQADSTPDDIAILSDKGSLTYAALNARANRLGKYLRQKYAIRPDELIGIKAERSAEMILSVLAVLKSGGAYVPIDPEYPQQRIAYMIADSKCKVVLDEEEWERFSREEQGYNDCNPERISHPANLAYVIYTSGTTGMPKGCAILHSNLLNYIQWANRYYFNEVGRPRFGLFTSLSFDLTVTSIFCSLTQGGSLRIYDQQEELSEILKHSFGPEGGIDSIKLTPSHINILGHLDIGPSMMLRAIVGGEPVTPEQVRILKKISPSIKIYNEYGPTEATVGCIVKELEPEAPILIGKPIDNTGIYILSEGGSLCPIGVPGELYISGAGLARGYLNNAELTAEKFVVNPQKEGERIYKTGDLGRWMPDGNIEYLGRKDEQIKIRGYRIEPGEIEGALQAHPAIDSAAVIARPGGEGRGELVAYVVSRKPLNASYIRAYLSKLLPAYMLPSHFVQLKALPLTSNGKVDRRRLPYVEGLDVEKGVVHVAPRNEIERHLAMVCEEVLKVHPIGMQDDFFVLGGDSIKSIQIVSRLKQRGYSLTIRDILTWPILADLAERIGLANRPAQQGAVAGGIPLSPIQAFFLQGDPANKHHFNQSVLLCTKNPISEEAIKSVLERIVIHHDALRMVYRKTAEGWIQENMGEQHGYSLEVIEVSDDRAFAAHCNRIQSGFNLEKGPLFKAALFRGLGNDRLLLVAHHLIIDGVSWRILFEDLSSLCQQYQSGRSLSLPLKTDSFRYWVDRQIQYSKSDALLKEEPYWAHIAAVAIKPLPLDYPGGSNFVKDGSISSLTFDAGSTDRLLTKCYSAYRTGINDLLLTALSLALRQVFEIDKVLINLEGHGREDIGADVDVSRTVGWFTTIYPVVIDIDHGWDILRQLIEVKETLHRVPNKGIGYGILRYLLNKEYIYHPEVTFNYLGDFGSGIEADRGDQLFTFSGDYSGREISADLPRGSVLNISGILVEGTLRLSIGYSTRQYSVVTIDKLLASFEQYLHGLIDVLSTEEKVHLTPVDLTYKNLSIAQVQELNRDFNIEDVYPLSPLQEGLYYHWLASPGSSLYIEQMSYKLKGPLNIKLVGESYRALVSRHGILRSFFTRDLQGVLLQVVMKEADSAFICQNASSAEDYKELDRARGFDLHRGSQMRLTVLVLEDDTHEFIWSHHHILMDGWCVGILISEFFRIYNGLLQCETPMLKKIYPYSNYIDWLSKIDKNASLQYWKKYLAGFDSITGVPKAGSETAAGYETRRRSFLLDGDIRKSINVLCIELGITENTFIQAVWGILLSKLNNTSDVLFGSVVSGRPADLKGVEDMVGLFSNTIPVRLYPKMNITVRELLKEVQAAAIESVHHHYVQLADVQSQSELGRNLFDHILVFENYPVQEIVGQLMKTGKDNSTALSVLDSEAFEQTNYDLTITVVPGESIMIRFHYNGNQYDEVQIDRLQSYFIRIVDQAVESPGRALGELSCLSDDEKRKLLVEFNNTAVDYPRDRTIVELFEEQARRTPDDIAVAFEETLLTYKQLNELANQVGAYLRLVYGVQPDDLVAVMLERTEWIIITILGIFKSGAAYVPIDPEYPADRISYVLTDSFSKVVIDKDELEKIIVNSEKYPIDNVAAVAAPQNLAYVIYTSGSTGRPKGVMIEHLGMLNHLYAKINVLQLNSHSIVVQNASQSFDISVWQFFAALLCGGKVLVYGQEKVLNPPELIKSLEWDKPTVLEVVPSYLSVMADLLDDTPDISLDSIEYLIVTGEELKPSLVTRWWNLFPGKSMVNAYGPTEASDDITHYIINGYTGGRRIPIGKAVQNFHIYILDDGRQLCPIGIRGEIYVSGHGVGRGYLNNESKTREVFMEDPFREEKGVRMYKTGDIGCYLEDGNILFFGRKDAQVKIRGNRIEPGEIENMLESLGDIDEAIVIAKTTADRGNELMAYFTGREVVSVHEIRTYLSRTLPPYMIPAHFVQVEEIPLTPNGKVDRNRLPDPEDSGTEYIAAASQTEEKLALIWVEILGVKKAGIKDDFFYLGGHSLHATRLASRIYKEFEVRVELRELMANAVLEDQARLIQQAAKTPFIAIPIAAPEPDYPLSSSQRRLWVLSRFEEGNIAYNVPGIYILEGEIDRDALEYSFNALIERHESLRTVFKENEKGEVRQFIREWRKGEFQIEYYDLREDESGEDELKDLTQALFIRPFDLSAGPLLRAVLFRIEGSRWVLGYVMHHIISDGWSIRILINELLVFYNEYREGRSHQLPPLRLQYKDYASWQQEMLKGDILKDHKRYWLEQFEGTLPILELPGDSGRPAIKTYKGGVIEKRIDPTLNKAIKALSQELGGTLYMGLLAVVDALLYKYTNQEDIIIGCPIAGREHIDLEDQIGFYVNTLALRTRFRGEDSYKKLFSRIKRVTLAAYDHQAYPFDALVDELNLHKDMSRNALFEVMVVLQNAGKYTVEAERPGDIKISAYPGVEDVISKFDLVFSFEESGEELFARIGYNNDIYHASTIRRIADHLEQLMKVIIRQPSTPIRDLDFLRPDEKHRLLTEFNDTGLTYPWEKTLVHLFEEQAKRTPDSTAVIFREKELAYSELNERSNRLAAYLRTNYKIQPDDLIGIKLERSEWIIVAILGVLKSGGAYVPIDPDYPQDHIDHILSDSQCKVVIDVWVLADFSTREDDYSEESSQIYARPGDLAYVIYTSGSTGQPKGVMIEHSAIVNTIYSQQKAFGVKEGDRNLQFASFSFDASVSEIFVSMVSGGILYIPEEDARKTPLLLEKYITEKRINIATIPPAYLRLLRIEEIQTLTRLVTAGEAANVEKALSFSRYGEYYNAYGPTESSICATIYTLPGEWNYKTGNIPIGSPISNTQIYILDDQCKLLPIGAVGEICIGGRGLARGYINRPDLTAEKFVLNPFRENQRIYKTGDLGRWLPDGNIEFIGRKDDQVKIRGYRIELGGIEAALQGFRAIDSAVVIARLNKEHDKELVAYVTGREILNVSDIRLYLSRLLPAYMIPSHFIQLQAFPLTPSGKIDKKNLPAPDNSGLGQGFNYEPPRNKTDEKLILIWQEILGGDKIGIKDDFFTLGGHSLKATRLIAQIKREFNVVIDLKSVFWEPTIEALSDMINNEKWLQASLVEEKNNYDEIRL
jgi:amino acid adenylation domain-containing protein/non-ribosomal peptide synthase protein (TIGR01720 family)